MPVEWCYAGLTCIDISTWSSQKPQKEPMAIKVFWRHNNWIETKYLFYDIVWNSQSPLHIVVPETVPNLALRLLDSQLFNKYSFS